MRATIRVLLPNRLILKHKIGIISAREENFSVFTAAISSLVDGATYVEVWSINQGSFECVSGIQRIIFMTFRTERKANGSERSDSSK